MKRIDDIDYVIWGTGDRSSSFSRELSVRPIFYIDNDIAKKGSVFFDRKVLHPTEIEDWSSLYIVVASGFYEDISKQLRKYGLKEEENFIHYSKIQNNNIRLGRLIDEVRKSMDDFKSRYEDYKHCALIFGSMVSFDKNSAPNCNAAFERQKNKKKFLMISETHAVVDQAERGEITFPFFCLPLMLWQNYHLSASNYSHLKAVPEVIWYVNAADYRTEAMLDFQEKNKDIAEDYAYYFIYYADLYLRELLSFIKPSHVCVWNSFYPFHQLIRAICGEMAIEVILMEYGGIPGTYLIERMGQMGESYPAEKWEEFQKLAIDKSDRDKAKRIYAYLKESGINRKPQPENDELEAAKKQINPEWPIVVYTGQNDYESGLYPYTEHAKRYHSPIFSSSHAAAYYLSELAARNNWTFIYKPHPLCLGDGIEKVRENITSNAIVIEKCNINDLVEMADLNITILSTTAYVSLIREKPVLMLGYTQLKHKGCTYEAFQKERIENEIATALKMGYTKEQREAFVDHIARITKYYAFDDMSERPIRYGLDLRQIKDAEQIIF